MNEKIIQIIEQLQHLNDTGHYTVLYKFSGHANLFQIIIYKGGWGSDKNPVLFSEYEIKDGYFLTFDIQPVIADFEDIMNTLKSFK